jgi:hypothetical protein
MPAPIGQFARSPPAPGRSQSDDHPIAAAALKALFEADHRRKS